MADSLWHEQRESHVYLRYAIGHKLFAICS